MSGNYYKMRNIRFFCLIIFIYIFALLYTSIWIPLVARKLKYVRLVLQYFPLIIFICLCNKFLKLQRDFMDTLYQNYERKFQKFCLISSFSPGFYNFRKSQEIEVDICNIIIVKLSQLTFLFYTSKVHLFP